MACHFKTVKLRHHLAAARVANFPEFYYQEEISGNFQKFSLIVNITDNRGTSVDLNWTMHAMPMRTINHKNNVLISLLLHY